MTDLQALLERVEKATGPDRALDALIEVEARRQEAYRAGLNDEQRARWEATPRGAVYDSDASYQADLMTESIDAALALTERLLPEANCYGVERDPNGWTAYVARNNVRGGHWMREAEAATAPLAIIAATLRALIAGETP